MLNVTVALNIHSRNGFHVGSQRVTACARFTDGSAVDIASTASPPKSTAGPGKPMVLATGREIFWHDAFMSRPRIPTRLQP